jgi:hypothetical protein
MKGGRIRNPFTERPHGKEYEEEIEVLKKRIEHLQDRNATLVQTLRECDCSKTELRNDPALFIPAKVEKFKGSLIGGGKKRKNKRRSKRRSRK